MPLPLPNLDDQPYADLVREARARIPALAPDWTNYNESDPGIVLVELLAWLTEMLNYRINQVPDESYWTFLALLGADIAPALPGWPRPVDLEEAIRAEVAALREPERAASARDYEHLACVTWNTNANTTERVARARCFADQNLEAVSLGRAPGHVSLVIVPDAPPGTPPTPPSTTLCGDLRTWLEPRCLLGVSLHVVGWSPVAILVAGKLVVRAGYAPAHHDARPFDDLTIAQAVRAQAAAALQQYVNPLTGGADGHGWPLGRDVYLSECYAVLCRLPGVDYVLGLQIVRADATATPEHTLPVISLQPHELPVISLSRFTVSVAGRAEEAGT